MQQSGKTLSMHNEAIWKGTYTNNGMLLKLHEHSYTIGYSALLSPDGASAGKVKFGDGVFYNAKEKNNKVYAGAPTTSEAVAKFAGIVVREPAVASGYPAINDEVASFQKGLLAKEGFVEYKEAFVIATGTSSRPASKVNTYDNVTIGYNMVVSSKDGAVYFSPDTTKIASTDVAVGKVIELNPDDKSVTVYISPSIYA